MLLRDKSNSSATAATAAHTVFSTRQRTNTKSAMEFCKTQELAINSGLRIASGSTQTPMLSVKNGKKMISPAEPAILASSVAFDQEPIGPTIEAKENPSKNMRFKSAKRPLTHLRLARKS